MKIYYIYYNKQFYNKSYGWVSHKRFADKLTQSEAKSLLQNFYKNAKMVV